jgi:hypothetical protein
MHAVGAALTALLLALCLLNWRAWAARRTSRRSTRAQPGLAAPAHRDATHAADRLLDSDLAQASGANLGLYLLQARLFHR